MGWLARLVWRLRGRPALDPSWPPPKMVPTRCGSEVEEGFVCLCDGCRYG
jgi:hypothetical protein